MVEDSRTQIAAEGDGVIEYVAATTIRVLYDRTADDEFVSFEPALKEYRIPKFRKTNQSTTIDLRPICDKGQRVKKGDILTQGTLLKTVNWLWVRTSWWLTCLGRVTTMRMLSY